MTVRKRARRDAPFLHIGEDRVVLLSEVVLILDAAKAWASLPSRECLQYADSEHRFIRLTHEPKAYVVTQDYVYASPTSALTLMRRSRSGEVG